MECVCAVTWFCTVEVGTVTCRDESRLFRGRRTVSNSPFFLAALLLFYFEARL
ncbi:unnamed protein product, partial [Dicrocoelium dendriticum]